MRGVARVAPGKSGWLSVASRSLIGALGSRRLHEKLLVAELTESLEVIGRYVIANAVVSNEIVD